MKLPVEAAERRQYASLLAEKERALVDNKREFAAIKKAKGDNAKREKAELKVKKSEIEAAIVKLKGQIKQEKKAQKGKGADTTPRMLVGVDNAENLKRFNQALLDIAPINQREAGISDTTEDETQLKLLVEDCQQRLKMQSRTMAHAKSPGATDIQLRLAHQAACATKLHKNQHDLNALLRQEAGAAGAGQMETDLQKARAEQARLKEEYKAQFGGDISYADARRAVLHEQKQAVFSQIESIFDPDESGDRIKFEFMRAGNNPVIKITDQEEGRSVCFRVLPIHNELLQEGLTCQDARQLAEAKKLPALQAEQYLCAYLGSENDQLYLEICDFVPGGTLSKKYRDHRAAMDAGERDAPNTLLHQVSRDMSDLVSVIRQQTAAGIYIPDIKPENVMLDDESNPVFGDTKAFVIKPDNPTLDRSFHRNEVYMSTESYRNDATADLDLIQAENLLATTYELLVGEPPPRRQVGPADDRITAFDADSMKQTLKGNFGAAADPIVTLIDIYANFDERMAGAVAAGAGQVDLGEFSTAFADVMGRTAEHARLPAKQGSAGAASDDHDQDTRVSRGPGQT